MLSFNSVAVVLLSVCLSVVCSSVECFAIGCFVFALSFACLLLFWVVIIKLFVAYFSDGCRDVCSFADFYSGCFVFGFCFCALCCLGVSCSFVVAVSVVCKFA